MRRLILARRASQIFFAGLFVYILWSTTYPLKGLLPPETFFRINPLVMFFTSISERHLIAGSFAAAGMLLLTLIFGRFFCGWICPLGSAIDLAGCIRKKMGRGLTPAPLRALKYAGLAVITALAVFGIQAAWVLDPMVITARFISLNMIPAVTFAVDSVFISVIKGFRLYGPVYDFYRELKAGFLGVKVYYFDNAPVILAFFLVILATTFFMTRFWCRAICPLGALYSIFAKFSLLKRRVAKCTDCGICVSGCRMGAIKNGNDYAAGECILCMDCVYECPGRRTSFGFSGRGGDSSVAALSQSKGGVTRRDFLKLLGSSLFIAGAGWGKKLRFGKRYADIIRPPGALKEDRFLNRCVRCGNCMKVCITNGLQPVMFEEGLRGVWTPRLVPDIGYCEYNCTLCGNVCPTGAIPRLPVDVKRKTKLGVAVINRDRCVAWANNEQCIVCEEHCPIPEKAIKVVYDGGGVPKPVVDEGLCVGCGICQNKCPAVPLKAIVVTAKGADRG